MPIVEKTLYVSLIVFAFMAIQTPKLRRSVIFLAVFSAASAFVYILLGAPDAALAEAVIGSTIATVIYLSALQKYKVFTVYYTNEKRREYRQTTLIRRRNAVLNDIEAFCTSRDLEAQVVYTTESLESVHSKRGWDIVVRRDEGVFTVYGLQQNYHVEELAAFLGGKKKELGNMGYTIRFIIE
ncbi:MAG: DUF4040 domain-containing protein [Clostridia bacterium]|nr:DUF4040 domain-containing protein [Clostridia bacterium]